HAGTASTASSARNQPGAETGGSGPTAAATTKVATYASESASRSPPASIHVRPRLSPTRGVATGALTLSATTFTAHSPVGSAALPLRLFAAATESRSRTGM